MQKLKIAVVVQRYGPKVIGGAEVLTRQVMEQLHLSLGWDIDVYTTTAQEYMTWANFYPAGVEALNGITIRRFNSIWPRSRWFNVYDRLVGPWLPRFKRRPWARWIALLLEHLWIILQGPYCPSLLRELQERADDYKKIIFVTYLYYPTLAGVRKFKDKAILIPLAHDERPFHFLLVERLLRSVQSILTNTEPEAQLIRSKLAGKNIPVEHAGVGFDEALYVPDVVPSLPASSQEGGALAARPYMLYLGRISVGKGVAQLISWFEQLSVHPLFSRFDLYLAGHLEDSVHVPSLPQFKYLGFVSEEQKLKLMREASVIINPSPHESLSIIVIEAMALKRPILVNSRCEVLRYYTEHVPTAYGFNDLASFEEQLRKMLTTNWTTEESQQQLELSRKWALDLFSWRHIISVYKQQVEA